MKNSLKFLVLCSVLLSAAFANAQDAKRTAGKIYAQYMRYMDARNLKGIGNLLDATYTLTDAEGKVSDRASVMAQMVEMSKMVGEASGSITVDQATQYGDEIIIWASMQAKMKMKTNGKWSTMEFNEKFVETIKKTPQGWKFTSSIQLP